MNTSTANLMLARLKDKLGTSFTNEVSIERPLDAPSPFLLLKQGKDVAGITVCDRRPQDCYELSYQYFKGLYAIHRDEWHDANLSFVLGVEQVAGDGDSDSDSEFFVKVETDDLFCRKFVLRLAEPLERRLARLPFIPISQAAAGVGRPLAAQTLLRRHELSSSLAKDICQPHARGASAIVELCLSGQYGPSVLAGDAALESQLWSRPASQVTIRSLSVENFRAYRQKQTFDLDADIVFLYGPNGFGKTSFFDAFDFVCTGEISRLQVSESRYLRAVAHLSSGPANSRVEVEFEAGGRVATVARTAAEHASAASGGAQLKRKEVLATLAGLDSADGDRVDVLARVFRATHLFGQKTQELFADLEKESCSLSSDVVSRILAIEDYANALKKLDEIRKECVRRERDIRERIGVLKNELTEAEGQRTQLAGSTTISLDPEALKDTREKARRSVLEAGMSFPESPDVPSLRSLRAKLEAQLSEARQRRERLASLKAMLRDVRKWEAETGRLQEQITKAKREVGTEGERAHAQEEHLAQLRAQQETAQWAAAQARDTLSAFVWLEQSTASLAALKEQEAAMQAEIARQEPELQAIQDRLREANADEERRREGVLRRSVELEQAISELARCQELLPSISALQESRAERARLISQEAAGRVALSTALNALNEGLTQQSRREAELQTLRKRVNQDAQRRADLSHLLSELERHVVSDTCPACGSRHDSADDVKRHMQERRARLGETSDEAEQLGQLSTEVSEVNRRVLELRRNVAEAEDAGRRIREQLAQSEKAVARIVMALKDAGFEAEADLDSEAADKTADLARKVKEAQARLADSQKDQGASFQTTIERLNEWNASITAKKESLERVRISIRALEEEARERMVSLSLTSAILASEREAAALLATDRVGQVKAVADAIEAACADLEASRRKLRNQEREVSTLQGQLHVVQASTGQWREELRLLGFTENVTEEDRGFAEEAETKRCMALEAAREVVVTLELAEDAAATTAAAATIAQRIGALIKQQADCERDAGTTTQLKSDFDRIALLLEGERGRIIELYTAQCGPRASVIQQRLRTVLGFGEITLTTRGARIDVRVSRETEKLVPSDFFSESQQQVLMLSLFLATFTTQTWSGFAGALLDDPVKHFDDLNCYAFLELLAGLIAQEEEERRQFIVSTCDKRLFRLARQRLRSLDQRAKFLELTSTGKAGPVVERVQ